MFFNLYPRLAVQGMMQQRQPPPVDLPGFKFLGSKAKETVATKDESPSKKPDKVTAALPEVHSPDAASEPENDNDKVEPLSAKEQADAMLKAFKARGADDSTKCSRGRPRKRPAAANASPMKKSAVKAMKKVVMKAMKKSTKTSKKSVQTSKKLPAKSNDQKAKKEKVTAPEKSADLAKMAKLSKAQRVRFRPNGCSKCRNSPGCSPSCFR